MTTGTTRALALVEELQTQATSGTKRKLGRKVAENLAVLLAKPETLVSRD